MTLDNVRELRELYDTTDDPWLRARYQMVLLAFQGRSVTEIATIMFCNTDRVRRALHRYEGEGSAGLRRRPVSGRPPKVTQDWVAELLRVIDMDPHEVGVPSANWTTGTLATYLAEKTGVAVSDEAVRRCLHAHGYVCKRPTWSLKRKAAEQSGYRGNA